MTNKGAGGKASSSGHSQGMVRNWQEITQIAVNPVVYSSSNLQTRRRKLVSKVWVDFIKVKDGDGNERAVCKQCQKTFVGSSKSGTTHLRNHLKCCRGNRLKEQRDGDEPIQTVGDDLTAPVVIKENCEIDQVDLVKMVIKRGLTLQSIRGDIRHFYRVEKEKLRRCLSQLSCRISLTIDALWIPFDNYLCLTVCFIDDNWELKNKIVSLKYLECEGNSLQLLKSLLLDWEIDNNICSVMSVNTVDVDGIKYWLIDRGSFPVNREVRFGCLVDVLASNNVSDFACEVIQKIKGLFYHIYETIPNQNKFHSAVEKAKFLGKKVNSRDVPTTLVHDEFKLLEAAAGFKEAFYELEQIDSGFKSVNLTKEEWDEAVEVYDCWKGLNDAARSFSESIFPTANVYFCKVCEIYTKLLQWEENGSWAVQQIASSVIRDFVDEYWSNHISVLTLMVVLDPRFKMDIIEHWYKNIYGNDLDKHLVKVIDDITNVYNQYSSFLFGDHESSSASYKMVDEESSNSELNRYLKEPKSPSVDEFNILTWWRMNGKNFPLLARMARDYLAIPFSTAFSNSAVKAKMQNLVYSVDFGSDIREAFICTKYWLENP